MVELISIGLNPRCRVNIEGLGNVKTTREFELACIHNQNVEASNELSFQHVPKNCQNPRVSQSNKYVNNEVSNVKYWYNCGKEGQITVIRNKKNNLKGKSSKYKN